MRVEAKIDPFMLKDTVNFLLAFPKEINTAKYRTLRKTVKWASTQLARKLATENLMPVGVFKYGVKNKRGYRVRTRKIGFNTTKAQLWSGANSVKAKFLGKARETKKGVTVGSGKNRRFYQDAFLIGRGNNLPSVVFREKGGRIKSITEPVWDVPVDDIEAQIQPELYKRMDQELNYILNHAKTSYQKTGRL